MSWGTKITIVYILFASLIGTMVTVCIMQDDIFLVEKEYYNAELDYQSKIDGWAASKASKARNVATVTGGILTLTFPKSALPDSGNVWLYRANDARQDIRVALAKGEELQTMAKHQLSSGLWKVKVDWVSGGKKLYSEQRIVIP